MVIIYHENPSKKQPTQHAACSILGVMILVSHGLHFSQLQNPTKDKTLPPRIATSQSCYPRMGL